MGRDEREAKLEALYGGDGDIVIVRERGGRKSDKDDMMLRRQGGGSGSPSRSTGYRNNQMMLPKHRREFLNDLKAEPPAYQRRRGNLSTASPTDAPAVLSWELDQQSSEHEDGTSSESADVLGERYDSVGSNRNVRTTRPVGRGRTRGGYQSGSLPSLQDLQRQLMGQMTATRRRLKSKTAQPIDEMQEGSLGHQYDPADAAPGKPAYERYQQGPWNRTTNLSYQEGSVSDGYAHALGEAGKMRGQMLSQGGDELLGGPVYTADIPMHAGTHQRLARTMQPYTGAATAPILEGAGYANEVVDFWRRLKDRALGNAPSGQTGFDESDLIANRLGIMRGMEEGGPGPGDRLMDFFRSLRRDDGQSTIDSEAGPSRSTGIRG